MPHFTQSLKKELSFYGFELVNLLQTQIMRTKDWLENRENFKNKDKLDYNKRDEGGKR